MVLNLQNERKKPLQNGQIKPIENAAIIGIIKSIASFFSGSLIRSERSAELPRFIGVRESSQRHIAVSPISAAPVFIHGLSFCSFFAKAIIPSPILSALKSLSSHAAAARVPVIINNADTAITSTVSAVFDVFEAVLLMTIPSL